MRLTAHAPARAHLKKSEFRNLGRSPKARGRNQEPGPVVLVFSVGCADLAAVLRTSSSVIAGAFQIRFSAGTDCREAETASSNERDISHPLALALALALILTRKRKPARRQRSEFAGLLECLLETKRG
jgi:hypothetical protein